ncbi:MAG: DUF5684 domain-containing protein [Candidatus Microsaccharimonas sp.]
MTFLSTIAQSYSNSSYDSYYTTSAGDTAAGTAIGIGVFIFYILFIAAIYVVSAIFTGKIFKKAGVESWIAWVPFYSGWKLNEIGGQQGFWAILTIVPIVQYVSIVFMFISMYHIGKKLGKEGTFILLGIFLPLVWIIWLAIDKSTWNDSASSARSLDPNAAAKVATPTA